MVEIRNNQRVSLLESLAFSVQMTTQQRADIRSEVLTDPAGMGYNGKPNKRKYEIFCTPRLIPNPDPQGTVIDPSIGKGVVRVYNRMLANGHITQQQYDEDLKIPNPNWSAEVEVIRSDVVLGTNILPLFEEFVTAIS